MGTQGVKVTPSFDISPVITAPSVVAPVILSPILQLINNSKATIETVELAKNVSQGNTGVFKQAFDKALNSVKVQSSQTRGIDTHLLALTPNIKRSDLKPELAKEYFVVPVINDGIKTSDTLSRLQEFATKNDVSVLVSLQDADTFNRNDGTRMATVTHSIEQALGKEFVQTAKLNVLDFSNQNKPVQLKYNANRQMIPVSKVSDIGKAVVDAVRSSKQTSNISSQLKEVNPIKLSYSETAKINQGKVEIPVMESRLYGLTQYNQNLNNMSKIDSLSLKQKQKIQSEIKIVKRDIGALTDSIATRKKELGGISLDSRLLDLKIKRDGNGVPLPLFEQPINNMNIEGFVPVIINIHSIPFQILPLLSEFSGEEAEESLI